MSKGARRPNSRAAVAPRNQRTPMHVFDPTTHNEQGRSMRPVQRAQGLAKKYGTTMWVFSNLCSKKNAPPYMISDVDPGPDAWPCTVVNPDGSTERRDPRRGQPEATMNQ